jgi:hypothetical protein
MPSRSTGKNFEGDSRRAGMSRGKAIEIVWPQCVAITISVLYCWMWNPLHPVTDAFKDVLSDTATCAVSGFGFLLAASAILVGIKGSWYKQRAQEAGVYYSLVRRLFIAMWWCLALTISSLLALSCGAAWWKLPANRYLVAAWLYVALVAVTTTVRALSIFSKLFLLIAEE